MYKHHTNQLARKVRRLLEGLKLYYDRFSSGNGPGIFQNSAKVIAWRSVSFRWHVITYQTKKLFRFSVCILCPLCILQSTFCIWSAASSLTFVLTGIRGTNTIYFWSQLFAQHTQSTTRYLCVSLFDIFVLFRVNTLLSFCKNADITYNVSSNPLTPQKKFLACIACLCLT